MRAKDLIESLLLDSAGDTVITIYRDEEPLQVNVGVRMAYRGTGSVDDPSEYEAESYGTTVDGDQKVDLTDEEMEDAIEAYLSR